ncbi:MAG: PilN domain-containing protein [Candidatus Omnitrophica bacterium]|nr:PilN domain-containing protein [Candidatus Omnitrophota bacterium]
MIKINLLPAELKPKKKTTLPVKAMSLIGGGIVVILILIHVLVGMKINQEKERLSLLKKEYEAIRPEYERVLKLKADKERLESKVALMEKLLIQRLLWAKKLNQFSDLMPPSVWLSSVSVVTRTETPTLVIRGKTYSDKGEKMVEQVGDFMRRIKGHGAFFEDFVNVELVSTERETIGKTELMRFELTCQFK